MINSLKIGNETILNTKRIVNYENIINTGYIGHIKPNGKLFLQGSSILLENLKCYFGDERIIINRGGTRSTKTISLLQQWIMLSFSGKYEIAICRQTFPALRLTALKDFVNLLIDYNFYDYFVYNKTHNTFTHKHTGSVIYFIAYDKPQKARGAGFDFIHLEEANEMPYETYKQLLFRLANHGKMYISFNPSDENVWINTEIELKRTDFKLIKSSYLDNNFLGEHQIKEIEYLKETDLKYWQVFGLGEYGSLTNKIYPTYKVIKDIEFERISSEIVIGIDYGYIHPMAMVAMKYKEGNVYIKELICKSYSTDQAKLAIEVLKANKIFNAVIYSEHDPGKQDQLRAAGYKVINASKEVAEGLDFVRKFKIHITESSPNIIKEIVSYSYKQDNNGNVIEEPIKFNDDLMDAKRYVIYSHLKGKVFKHGIKTHN
jgi:phage terminase large subunit